jgi:hypothetical protein
MKKVIAFVILYSSFVILLCSSANAQWEDAQVQRLTFDHSACKVIGLHLGDNDKLCMFYRRWQWNPLVQPYRDTLMVMFKEKDQAWTQPQKIGYEPFDLSVFDKYPTYEARSELIHIFYTSYPYFGRAETLYYWNTGMQPSEPVKVDWLNSTYNQEYNSLATEVDTLGNVHVAWHVDFDSAGSGWYRVMYASNSTGDWIKQEVSLPIGLGGFGSGNTEMSIQDNGAAHIIYHGEPHCGLECNSFYVRNDSLNSTNWVMDTVPKPPRPLWYFGAGEIEVDVNDTVHLLCFGCIAEDCVWAGLTRSFYYRRAVDDTLWTDYEIIPDSMFAVGQMFIDRQSIPHVLEYDSYHWYFTGREGGSWDEPYQILDDTYWAKPFLYVLDSQGKGHGVFSGCLFPFMAQDDSLEVFYFGASGSSVEDRSRDETKPLFQLLGNYPNPFNQNTLIVYSLNLARPMTVRLIIRNVLGEEVKELVNSVHKTGRYEVLWDGTNSSGKEVASGIYFYQLRVAEGEKVRKMLLVK